MYNPNNPNNHTQNVNSPHSRTQSQPMFLKFASQPMTYRQNPISHFSSQYKTHNNPQTNAPMNPPISSKPAIASTQSVGQAKNGTNHNRHSSLSMSYIQQQQLQFFSDAPPPPEPLSDDSDDDIYEDMYPKNKHNKRHLKRSKTHSQSKQSKQIANNSKSRKETEDVWCCSICTYQNNMLLHYCELCGCKKGNDPNIVKRAVLVSDSNVNNSNKNSNSRSPSPSPSPMPMLPPQKRSLLDLNDMSDAMNMSLSSPNNDSFIEPEFQQKMNSTVHSAFPQIDPPPKPNNHKNKLKRGSHRYTRSETHLLQSKKRGSFWQCSVCTFAENPMDYPVCKLCSALPAECPPSPNPSVISSKKEQKLKNSSEKEKMFEMKKIISSAKMANEMESDPLGGTAAKRCSITHIPMIDASVSCSSKPVQLPKQSVIDKQMNKPVVLFDYSSNNSVKSVKSENEKQIETEKKSEKNNNLLVAKTGKSYHEATISGRNIIFGLAPNTHNLSVNQSFDNTTSSSNKSGIGGFFGKMINRRRAQSTDNDDGSGATNKRNRSKSPRSDKFVNSNVKRNISVANMPKKQQQKIAKRLGALTDKKALMHELDNSMLKLQKKLKQHAGKVMALKREMSEMQSVLRTELAQWKEWYILELIDLGSDYHAHQSAYLSAQIDLEKLHIECFTEKLQRLENASRNIRKNKKWIVDDVRNNIEVAFHTAWRIRLSQDVPDKQDYVKQLAQICEGQRRAYASLREQLNRKEISIEERKEDVFMFLQSIFAKYESTQMASNKSFRMSRNLENCEDFYCPLSDREQNVFDSFVLDRRTKEGRIVHRWIAFVRKKHREMTLTDLSDFLMKLGHTFVHSYSLSLSQYYELVRILCYRCVLRLRIIKRIVFDLLNGSPLINELDCIYSKKVMWMRVLNEKQLGIKNDFWFQTQLLQSPNANNSENHSRRSSQIAFVAGSDIPFADAINLMGQLEIEYDIVDEWKRLRSKLQKPKSQIAQNESRSPRMSFLSNKNKAMKAADAKTEKTENNNGICNENRKKERAIVPFLLPSLALNTLLRATKCVYQNAMKYYYLNHPDIDSQSNNDEAVFISQDDLFPIILYCVMQSKLETPHRLIHFIEHILPKNKTQMGQSAFALSALKAAVEYISQSKPQTFGMDAEIELD